MNFYLEKLFNTLSILQTPKILRELFRSKAFSAPCFRLIQALRCHQNSFGTMLDVGANIGQFALAANLHFPNSRIYSFEPLPDAFSELLENTRAMKSVKGFNCALGEYRGQLPFYRNQYSRLSSSMQIDKTNDHARYRERNTSLMNVDVFRLDEFIKSLKVEPPVLLKMDVQGMEKHVLLGAGEFLSQVDFILCEVVLVRLYEGQLLFDEMHEFIKHLGYRLVAPLYLNRGRDGTVIEMDVLYARAR